MSQSIFERLRELVFEGMGDVAKSIAHRMDVIPIEQTQDGWFCLLRDGQVVHMGPDGASEELVRAQDRATALVGNLAVRFPMATWFVPRANRAATCPTCAGSGKVPGLPADLRSRIVCRCGGLGWVPVSSS
jgi:hypothetical protein